MKRPRLSLRLAMLLMTIVAMGCYGWRLRERCKSFQRHAIKHELLSELLRDGHADTPRNPRCSAYHAALAAKYQRAARYPWLAAEPDPPEPR